MKTYNQGRDSVNLTADQLQELKIREREMLECFVNICNKYDIRYFVQGGTLLGTVRHGGLFRGTMMLM